MRASVFVPLTLRSVHCARGNHFYQKMSFVHHRPEIICTKLHDSLSKNGRSARISVHFCTINAGLRAQRARTASQNNVANLSVRNIKAFLTQFEINYVDLTLFKLAE